MSKKQEKSCKVILVGESAVGKTCIIRKFADDEYDESTTSTMAASCENKKLCIKECNTILEYEVWDTVGQENYRGLSKIFYQNSKIVIMVYDISSKNSFDEIKNFWYKQVRENSSDNISK